MEKQDKRGEPKSWNKKELETEEGKNGHKMKPRNKEKRSLEKTATVEKQKKMQRKR